MEIRKFVVTLHENGSVTWNEYEDPEDVIQKARRAGYEQAQCVVRAAVKILRAEAMSGRSANPILNYGEYQGALEVEDRLESLKNTLCK